MHIKFENERKVSLVFHYVVNSDICVLIYSVIQKDGLSFVRLYFLNYTRYVNDLHNILKRRS